MVMHSKGYLVRINDTFRARILVIVDLELTVSTFCSRGKAMARAHWRTRGGKGEP